MPRAWYFTEKTKKIAQRLAVFFGTLAVLWFLSTISWFAPAIHAVRSTVYAVSSVTAQTFSRIFASEESIARQRDLCLSQLAEQSSRAATLTASADEVEEWRQLLGYENRITREGIAARIISRGTAASSIVVIDRGSHDGVQVGAAVIVNNGLLIGSITKVGEFQSTVRLIEDRQSVIPAAILGQQRTIGLITGNEGAVVSMNYIPQDAGIVLGDSVVTSGLGGKIPEGLFLGIVTAVTTEQNAPFVVATVTPVHDSRDFTAVLVLSYAEIAPL
ncbi:MAG: rod shape-determining protein MreC [Patescibacteria group bacterium]